MSILTLVGVIMCNGIYIYRYIGVTRLEKYSLLLMSMRHARVLF